MTFTDPPYSLRPWQSTAINAWEAHEYRGIVAAATGTGKTLVAVEAIRRSRAEGFRTLITVPKVALIDQWRGVLIGALGLHPGRIGLVAGGSPGVTASHEVVLSVLNSARRAAASLVGYWSSQGYRSFLIVDECHWTGTVENSRVLRAAFSRRLGLSATPERDDGGFDDLIAPLLGPVVHRYRLRTALDDGLLAPLRATNVYFDLTGSDRIEYQDLSDKIARGLAALDSAQPGLLGTPRWLEAIARLATHDPLAKTLHRWMSTRRKLVADARARGILLRDLVSAGTLRGRRSLLFHETIAAATATHQLLASANISAALEHSGLPPPTRAAALRRFAAGSVDALVVVRTADEGIDVPEADFALIVSGTLTARQRIQRIGRILRPGSATASCVTLLARGTTEEAFVGAPDADLLGAQRVRHHRWPNVTPHDAMALTESTYIPRTS